MPLIGGHPMSRFARRDATRGILMIATVIAGLLISWALVHYFDNSEAAFGVFVFVVPAVIAWLAWTTKTPAP